MDLRSWLAQWVLTDMVTPEEIGKASDDLLSFTENMGGQTAADKARAEIEAIASSSIRKMCDMTKAGEANTVWGHDYASGLTYSLRRGARWVTSNPCKIQAFKKDFPEHYQDLVAEIKRENAGADASVMAAQMFTKVCAISARALYPIFEATNKEYGFVCMQVDPREVKNTDAMIRQVDFWYEAMKKELGVEEPNVVFKLPAVEPAFKAAEELLKKNYKLCMTLNFTLTQHEAFAEILSKGNKPGYLVLMAGQLDDQYFRADGHFVILAESGTENGIEIGDQTAPLFASEDYSRPDYTLVLRLVEHPWRAAAASMGNIYLWGALLTLVCVLFVLYIVEATFRKRAAMERQQRDFTNAIAHEMKTPLAVIRGFAENLEENTNEEKKKYYLEQIIGQTERMDDMVKEMVFISRMDSKDYRPVKEQISVRALLDELTAVYSAQIEEKQIELSVSCREDFLIDGDRRFVEKAFAGLLSNAVDHNRQEGKIRIDIDRDRCVIANTGERIPEEDLPRVCELFFTGNKSRGGEEKHLGIGLYLADRIFRTHGLGLKVENTADGVQVTVKR